MTTDPRRTQGAGLHRKDLAYGEVGRACAGRGAEPDGAGPVQSFLSDTARELKMWILGGTIVNRGLLGVRTAGFLTGIYAIDGPVTLSGGGTLLVSGGELLVRMLPSRPNGPRDA